jgi:hypothetical protein
LNSDDSEKSDEGAPLMWEIGSAEQVSIEHLQLRISGPITDSVWSRRFNIVAFSGFVEECLIFVYGNVAKEQEQQAVLALMHQQTR